MRLSKASPNAYYFLLYLTAFVIPLPFIAAPIAIILLSIGWLLTVDYKTITSKLLSRKGLLLWILFFILHSVSYFYSDDKHQALFDLQTKVSFLILPLVIGTGAPIRKTHIENVFSAFIVSLFIITLYSFGQAALVYHKTHNTHVFFYHDLVGGLDANAVYYSLYTFLALTFLLINPTKGIFSNKKVLYPVVFILLAFFILLAARILLLLFFVTVVPTYLWRVLKGRKTLGLIYGTIGAILIYVIFFTKNPIQNRYNEILEKTSRTEWLPEYSQGKKQHFTNLTLRLFLWNIAVRNVIDNDLWFTGCGTGDVTELQKQQIKKYGTTHEILNVDPPLWEYNIHNMYLQTLLMLGIPGLVVFLLILFLPFTLVRYIPNKLTFIFINISVIVFMIQESAFQTQAGIVYYCFFSTLLFSYTYAAREQGTAEDANP
jgi:O-antigen ligase